MEQSLVEHVSRGEWLDLAADDEVVDEGAMRSWGKARTCRATVIRDILRGRLAADPDPHGLRLRGARIIGRLDLASLSTEVNFELRDCLLEEGILAPDAHLATVSLSGCHLEHPTEPPLDTDRLTCNVLILIKATIIGHAEAGAVLLRGAHTGLLHCGGARLCNDSGPGLRGDGLQVGRGMYLRREFTATGTGRLGTVCLLGAHIGGSLECDGASLRNDSGPALLADGLQVDLDMQCDRLMAEGGVVLGGHIGRLLSFAGAALDNRGGFALLSDGLRVDGAMFCRNGFTAQGEVRLPGARIGGRLYFDGAKLSNPGGRALVASRLIVGQDMFCRNRGGPEHGQPFVAEGAVVLSGAHIGGHLSWDGAQLCNDSGAALDADSLQVDQDMFMRHGFTATGSGGLEVDQDMFLRDELTATRSGGYGAIYLTGAHVGARLLCDGASLRNDSGPALIAYGGLQVGQGVFLRSGFTATGVGERGAIHLIGAQIGGSLDCTGADLRNDSGPALIAGGLQVGQSMHLTGGFTATGGGADVAVNLTATQVGGTLAFHPARLEHTAGPHRRLAVDGLTYTGVPQQISARAWLDLLRNGTPGYAAQPYQQLAAGYRALGDERQARDILMAQRDDELARADTRWPERLWGKITKYTLGYGYQPTCRCRAAPKCSNRGALQRSDMTATGP